MAFSATALLTAVTAALIHALRSSRRLRKLKDDNETLLALENVPRDAIDNLIRFIRELASDLITESDDPEHVVVQASRTRIRDGREIPGFLSYILPLADYRFYGIISFLKKEYPELTADELSVCALTCLGFSSEVSRYLMQMSNPASFYNMRSRIRRKLRNADCETTLDRQLESIVEELKKNFCISK